MKKISIGILILAVLIGFFCVRQATFSPERILAHSVFKQKVFSGQTVEVATADKKITAYLMEEHSVPLVAIAFGFDNAGKAYETKVGVALLTESSLLDGAGDYSRQELREIMKEKGIKLSVAADKDRLAFLFSYVKDFEKEAIDVLKAVLYEPHLKADDLDLTRRQLAAMRRQQKENPSYHLQQLVKDKFYHNHPYGKENIPDEKTLEAVDADDIRAYLQTVMGKDKLKIGVSGDIGSQETIALLKDIFSALPDKAKTAELAPYDADFTKEKAEVKLASSAQSFVLLTTHGIKRLDEDFYPLYIADYVFGGSGLNSRLNKAVREEKGLTYGIYSYLTNSDAIDLWNIYFSATPDNAAEALKITEDEYVKFYQKGITADELQMAKKSLLSSFNLRFSSLINIAEMLEMMQVENLGIDFLLKRQSMVEKVTLKEVNKAIQKHLPKTLNAKDGVRSFTVTGEKK